ncbi:hypothetical protein GE09DRAFT_1241715, partial [Coniochaeta sp. 2T2.1]
PLLLYTHGGFRSHFINLIYTASQHPRSPLSFNDIDRKMQRSYKPRRWTKAQVEFVLSQFAAGMQARDVAELFNARSSPTTITETQVRSIRWTYRDVDNPSSDASQTVSNLNRKTIQPVPPPVSSAPQVITQPSNSSEGMNCRTLHTSLTAALVHAAATNNLTITVEEDIRLHGNRIGIPYYPPYLLVHIKADRLDDQQQLNGGYQGNSESFFQEQPNQHDSERQTQRYYGQPDQSYNEQHRQLSYNQANEYEYDHADQHYSEPPDQRYNMQQSQNYIEQSAQYYNNQATLHSTQLPEPGPQLPHGSPQEQRYEPYQDRPFQIPDPAWLNHPSCGNQFQPQPFHGYERAFPSAPVSIPMNTDGGRVTDVGGMGDFNHPARMLQHGSGTVTAPDQGGSMPNGGPTQHEAFNRSSRDSAYGQMAEPVFDPSLFDDFEDDD